MFSSFKLPFRVRSKSLSNNNGGNDNVESNRKMTETQVGSPTQKKNHKRRPNDISTCPATVSFRPSSVADHTDVHIPENRIRSADGILEMSMQPDELEQFLGVEEKSISSDANYLLPQRSQGAPCVITRIATITLERVDGSLGITLRGGVPTSTDDTQTVDSGPTTFNEGTQLIVTQVRHGGPAHRSGQIKVGDRLLQVDQHILANKSLFDAHQLLKQQTSSDTSKSITSGLSSTTLTIEYDISIIQSVKYATGPVLVEIERQTNEELGLILGTSCKYGQEESVPPKVYIEKIIPATIAERCGALHVGDQIIAINDTYLEETSATLQEVIWLLQNYKNSSYCTRIQIMPYHTIANKLRGTGAEWIDRGVVPSSSPTISTRSQSSCSRRGRMNFRPIKFSADDSLLSNNTSTINHSSRFSDSKYNNICCNVCPGPMCTGKCISDGGLYRVESLTVMLMAEEGKGYGLNVAVMDDGEKQANIIISKVNFDSPAYRSGCLQVGDRIKSVNGQCSLTLQEIQSLLDLGNTVQAKKILLQTEFDIVDTVVPTSGVFTVKLKKNGPDLGITVTSSKSASDDPFIISNIRKGSSAHRTGTLNVGDSILAIDNHLLDHGEIDTAFGGIYTSQVDVVILRIKKTGESECAAQYSEEIIYMVELNREGGPLGITVSGSENRSEPIILSALTQGGLAKKTGALHVGDRIIEINGENLENSPLSDAIRLLQTSENKIQIKIGRQIRNNYNHLVHHPDSEVNYSSPGLVSIDSAIDSWDSGVIEPLNSIQNMTLQSESDKDLDLSCSHCQDTEEITLFRRDDYKNRHQSQLLFYSDVDDSLCPSPLPLPNYAFNNTSQSGFGSSYLFCSKPSLSSRNDSNCGRQDIYTLGERLGLDLEIHYVTLHKDSVYDDYGFSVSDGLYERGVYINRIRRGGPAHLAGVLQPYDRILQVNGTNTKDFDCCLTVPLIASAGDTIEMIISRNPYTDCSTDKITHNLTWTPDDKDMRISMKSTTSSENTITKTF